MLPVRGCAVFISPSVCGSEKPIDRLPMIFPNKNAAFLVSSLYGFRYKRFMEVLVFLFSVDVCTKNGL